MPQLHLNRAGEPEDQRARMLETPVSRLLPVMAVPTIISMLVTSVYNMADTYFVSQLNTSASGAVGVVFSLMGIIQAIGFTVGVGAGGVASRLLGQDRREEADVYASSGVAAALVLGLLVALLGQRFQDRLIWLLGSTPTIYPYALDYAFYILLGAPVMILSFTLNNLLRWQGKASLSVFGLATGGVLNIILDPIFIYLFDMGIGGAGAATLLSQCVSLVILCSFFLCGKSSLRVSLARVSRSPRTYLAILRQGIPSFFRHGVMSASTMAMNYNARIYGDAAVAALAVVTKVFNLIQSIVIGFGQGFQPVMGYNYGAKRLDRVKEAIWFSVRVCTVILTAGAVIGFVLAPRIITLFRRDDALVIAIGTLAFRWQCLTLPLGAVLVFANMFFQALGKPLRAILLAVCRPGLYIPIVYWMAGRLGLAGLESAQAAADLLAFALSAGVLAHYFKFEFGGNRR